MTQNFLIDGDLRRGSASGVGAQNTIVSIRRKGRIVGRQALNLSQLFVIGKEKGLVFPDRPTDSAAILIAWKGGRVFPSQVDHLDDR